MNAPKQGQNCSSAPVSRRSFLAAAAAYASGLSVSGLGLVGNGKPNFVFILSDDQDWCGLSVPMHPTVSNSRSDFYRTPNLEALAGQGMRFSNAYAPAPVCSPTRISLQTGKGPAQLHWTKAAPVMTAKDGYRLVPPVCRKSISDDDITIAEVLKAAGYATAHYGKWHLRGGGPGVHGYDEHDGNTGNEDAAGFVDPNPVDIFGMSNRAIAFMEKNAASGTPFHVQLSYHALHYPENSLRSTQEVYRKRSPGEIHDGIEKAAITENLDTGVGMVVDGIEKLGIGDRTYVIYMSDNGAGGRSRARPLTGGKGSVWEGGIRVPLIIRGPGVGQNMFCHVPVVGYDLFPTFCDLAGVVAPLPEGIEGGSLSPLFEEGEGSVNRAREGLVFHFPHYQSRNGPQSAIRLGDFKLVETYETGKISLFDLSRDIGEKKDLSSQLPEKAADLHARLTSYLLAVGAQMPEVNPDHDPNTAPTYRRKRDTRNGKPHRKWKAGRRRTGKRIVE